MNLDSHKNNFYHFQHNLQSYHAQQELNVADQVEKHEYAPSFPGKMEENFNYNSYNQEEKPNRLKRAGLRNPVRGGEIVEVEGGHIVRSTGRKDRHSKVCTAKGPRDRRVRLSAHTAIQFYDVQDRLGYDRPSKAVDWLIKKAKSAIDELAELPPWKPTIDSTPVVNFEHNQDDEIVDNQMGTNQNSSFLPTSLDSVKSFFPMGGASAAPVDNNMQFHRGFTPLDMSSRTGNNQVQDLKLSLQSVQDPIQHHHHQQPENHHQNEQGNNSNGNNNMFFDGSGWPESGGFQRLIAYGGGGGGGSGDGVPNGFVFGSAQTTPFLQPLFGQAGQPTNNQLFNYVSQRGPLQSSNTPQVRAWVDPQPFSGVGIDQHQGLAFHYPSSMTGFSSSVGGFSGYQLPARIQGDDEEHDGVSDKPSSGSSDSHH